MDSKPQALVLTTHCEQRMNLRLPQSELPIDWGFVSFIALNWWDGHMVVRDKMGHVLHLLRYSKGFIVVRRCIVKPDEWIAVTYLDKLQVQQSLSFGNFKVESQHGENSGGGVERRTG